MNKQFLDDYQEYCEKQSRKWRESVQEIQQKEDEFMLFIHNLDCFIIDIVTARDIIKIDAIVASFSFKLEENYQFIINSNKKDQIVEKIFTLNSAICENPYTNFSTNSNNYESVSHRKITKNIQKMLEQFGWDPNILAADVMDTNDDEDLAFQLSLLELEEDIE